jgi:hypothetical protein
MRVSRGDCSSRRMQPAFRTVAANNLSERVLGRALEDFEPTLDL